MGEHDPECAYARRSGCELRSCGFRPERIPALPRYCTDFDQRWSPSGWCKSSVDYKDLSFNESAPAALNQLTRAVVRCSTRVACRRFLHSRAPGRWKAEGPRSTAEAAYAPIAPVRGASAQAAVLESRRLRRRPLTDVLEHIPSRCAARRSQGDRAERLDAVKGLRAGAAQGDSREPRLEGIAPPCDNLVHINPFPTSALRHALSLAGFTDAEIGRCAGARQDDDRASSVAAYRSPGESWGRLHTCCAALQASREPLANRRRDHEVDVHRSPSPSRRQQRGGLRRGPPVGRAGARARHRDHRAGDGAGKTPAFPKPRADEVGSVHLRGSDERAPAGCPTQASPRRAPLIMAWQDDMFVTAPWLVPELLRTFRAHPDLGLMSLSRGLDHFPVAEPIATWDDLVDWRRLRSTIGEFPFNWFRIQEVDAVIRPWVVRRECIDRVGLLDEAFVPTECYKRSRLPIVKPEDDRHLWYEVRGYDHLGQYPRI